MIFLQHEAFYKIFPTIKSIQFYQNFSHRNKLHKTNSC